MHWYTLQKKKNLLDFAGPFLFPFQSKKNSRYFNLWQSKSSRKLCLKGKTSGKVKANNQTCILFKKGNQYLLSYCLYCEKYEEDISCYKHAKFSIAPTGTLQDIYVEMKLCHACSAMSESKSFLLLIRIVITH